MPSRTRFRPKKRGTIDVVVDPGVPGDLASLPLYTGAQLFANALGGFYPPTSAPDVNGVWFDQGPKNGLAWNAANGTIYMPNRFNQICEVNIPTLKKPPDTILEATYHQPHTANATDGKDDQVDFGGSEPANTSGVLVYNGELIGTLSVNYDNANSGLAFYRRSLNTAATGTTIGIDGLINSGLFRFFNAGLCDVPLEWQAALGGPVMGVSGARWSVISTQSCGPSAATFNPAHIDGSHGQIAGNWLVGYPPGHRTFGDFNDWPPPSQYYNFSAQVFGGFIPDGTRNMVFLGSMGARDSIYAGYGTGVATIAEHGVLYPDPVTGPFKKCYDPPFVGNSGGHCYPYLPYAWIYDLNDFAAVKAGTKQPWELVPVELFNMEPYFPITITDPAAPRQARGAAWDRVNRHLYTSQEGAGPPGNSGCIQCFRIPGTTP